jgi:hypothetical protein
VAASQDDGRVRWFENTAGNGSAWVTHQIATASTASGAVAADIDRDGDQDVIASSYGSNRIVWYENTASNGTAWTERLISTAAQGPECVYAVDIDRDGDIDILSASLGDNRIAWHENAGNGATWTMRTIATTAQRAWFVTAADIDGDGDADAISGDLFGDKVAWYQNPSSATGAWTERSISTANDDVRSVHAADMDKDGDQDVLAVGSANNRIAWYENTVGTGVSWTEHIISTQLDGAHSVVASDFDLDGDFDVAAAAFSGDSVVWFENAAGNASTWSATTLTRNLNEPSTVAVANVDSDCDPDLLVSAWGGSSVLWFENQGVASCGTGNVVLVAVLVLALLLLILLAFWKRIKNLVAGPRDPEPPIPPG